MFKSILLSLFIVFASSTVIASPDLDIKDLTEFLIGFNDQLQIESEKDLEKCTNFPLVKDISKLIKDLQESSPNPLDLVQDILNLYNDYNKIKTNCPETLESYEKFFSKFADSLKDNTGQTLLVVVENVIGHMTSVIADVKTLETDFQTQEYNAAGSELGQIVAMALAGYL